MSNLTQNTQSPTFAQTAYKHINRNLIDRDAESRLMVLALAAQEHIVLFGRPGTAKSMMARRIADLIAKSSPANTPYFEIMLNEWTQPDELFGPFSLTMLKEDTMMRETKDKLPTASVAFLDEAYKANPGLLNTLLTILCEREFDNHTREKCPLHTAVLASNEEPTDTLAAFHDRILFRSWVKPLGNEMLERLDHIDRFSTPHETEQVEIAVLKTILDRANEIEIDDKVFGALELYFAELDKKKVHISDRRKQAILRAIRCHAVLRDATRATAIDSWFLPNCTANDEKMHKGHQELWLKAVLPIEKKRVEEILTEIEEDEIEDFDVLHEEISELDDALLKIENALHNPTKFLLPEQLAKTIEKTAIKLRKLVDKVKQEIDFDEDQDA